MFMVRAKIRVTGLGLWLGHAVRSGHIVRHGDVITRGHIVGLGT